MADVLVVGSIGLDTVETPFGKVREVLGGSASYFALSASYFTKVKMVSIIGSDFPPEHLDRLRSKSIDVSGVEKVESKNFRWHGKYEGRMNSAITIATSLGAFGDFKPKIPESFKKMKYVFLGNSNPNTQKTVLTQMERPNFVLLDTMNLWIENEYDALMDLIKGVHGICVNYEEALELARASNFGSVVSSLKDLGTKVLVIKKAEHGAVIAWGDKTFAIPTYPSIEVKDPTGAGDAFAGGFLGYIAKRESYTLTDLKFALIYGAVMGSITVENFGTKPLEMLNPAEIEKRFSKILEMISL
ncbi:sugar kinase [Candidatus Peregrinibacteria bacterium]|nr:sugar kinase [Candidatus Peregrinibacteria bacterium]